MNVIGRIFVPWGIDLAPLATLLSSWIYNSIQRHWFRLRQLAPGIENPHKGSWLIHEMTQSVVHSLQGPEHVRYGPIGDVQRQAI